jgi:FKBP-type peptidyl-prolyl cis-trans isomerase SlpA
MGQGQLAPVLEELLLGLPEGTHKTFRTGAGRRLRPAQP